MASSTEQTLEYLVSEICKKAQSTLHHQGVSAQHNAQISVPIADLVLRAKIMELKLCEIDHHTQSVLVSPKQASQLISSTVDTLLTSHEAGIQTLKMQFTLAAMSKDLDADITKKIEFQRTMFSAQIEDIIKIIPYNASSITKLYDDLFELLCLNEKYIEGAADDDELDRIAEREINAALENVFPRAQIKQYKALSAKAKTVQVERLIDIIYGIRLYDRDIGKGGSSITDFPKLIEMDLSEMYGDINDKMEAAQLQIESYTKIIELEYAKPGTITVPLLALQGELRNRFQSLKYLKHYKDEIIQSTEILHTIIKKFNDELKSLHLLFKSEQNPLKTQVYPKFAQLAAFWKLIIAEKYCNESRKQILGALKSFEMGFRSSLNEKDIELTISTRIPQNENKFIPFHVIATLNPNIIQIDHSIFDPNDIKYNGFCLVSMADKNGMLCTGNHKQTLIQLNTEDEEKEKDAIDVKDNKYCFHTLGELKEFAAAPQKYFDALKKVLIQYPELVNLLGLNNSIESAPAPITALQLNSMLPHPMTDIPRKVSQGVGTPTHFLAENIVPEYSWNEWDLRRRALQIVNMRLKNMRTHSCQTDLSHFRRDNTTQYYLKQPLADGTMPGTETQTGIERGTNVAKKKQFITGLRGQPNEKVSVVTLTFDPPCKRMN